MLSTEYNNRLAAAESTFVKRSYEDMVKTVHTIQVCDCANLQLLWLLALRSYVPVPGAVNVLDDRKLNALFCRMGAGSAALPNAPTLTPPTPPDPPAPTPTFAAHWTWQSTDPYTGLLTADLPSYLGTGTFSENAFINADFKSAPIDQYLVVRYPLTEPTKTTWYNDIFNNGPLDDFNFRAPFSANGYQYIVSRIALSLNPSEYTKFS